MTGRVLASVFIVGWSSVVVASVKTSDFLVSAEAEAPVVEEARPEIRLVL